MAAEEDLEGCLTIEGPLLESAYAALCVSRGENVVPRYETMGVFHDILIKEEEGYVVGECLGAPVVSPEKLSMFREEVLKLNERLKAVKDNPVTEARLIGMSTPEEWPEESREMLRKLEEDLGRESIELVFLEPKRVLYDVISNSIIGLSLFDNHIIFVGPGEWAIRYNASVSKYRIGGSSIDFQEFRKLPHSFMPRIYWAGTHRKIFEDYSRFSGEPLPEWFNWSLPDNLGIRWRSVEQIKDVIIHSFTGDRRELIYDGKAGFITRRNLKKNPYYTANLIYHKPLIDSEDAINIDKAMIDLIDSARAEVGIDEDLEFYNRIFTDTVTFTHSYWAKARYKSYHGKVSYTEINRGEDLLMESLNSGVLGMKLSGGRITLSSEESPNTMKIVNGGLHWESELRDVYPAGVRF